MGDEFIASIRGVVSSRRQALIDMVFGVLDTAENGKILADLLAPRFRAQGHPDVAAGRLPPDQAVSNLLSQFDGVNRNGLVSRAEFSSYYKNISGLIANDDEFELMLRNSWQIGTGMMQGADYPRILVTLADGTQRVVRLEDDQGLDMRRFSSVKAKLEAQGIFNVVSFAQTDEP